MAQDSVFNLSVFLLVVNAQLPDRLIELIDKKGQESSNYFKLRTQKSSTSKSGKVFGIDVATPVTVDQAHCLTTFFGAEFIIPRGFRSLGILDANLESTVHNSWLGGFKDVDTYIFPCPKCRHTQSGAAQLRALENKIQTDSIPVEMIWLDIEGPEYWANDFQENQRFFEDMLLEAAKTKNRHYGIYASKSQWRGIFGENYTMGSTFPLWYPHYDHIPDFSDFVPFGGFTKPAIKQYADLYDLCGVIVDGNIYETEDQE